MGGYVGPVWRGVITSPTPAVFVCIAGWLLLLLPLIIGVVHVFTKALLAANGGGPWRLQSPRLVAAAAEIRPMKLPHVFRFWLSGRFRHEAYELCGSEIVRGRGASPEDRLQVADVTGWQVHPEMVFDVVEITLADGRRVVWLDKYDDLTSILRRVAPSREQAVA